MNNDEIKELIRAVIESGVADLEVQRGDFRVRIRRNARADFPAAVSPPQQHVHVAQPPPVASPPIARSAPPYQAPSTEPGEPVVDPSLTLVKAPIVGTFYDAPSPGAPSFVKVGDTVNPGQVLCIIESMKLMNEIEAEVAGVIASKLVENSHPVEYGEALFAIRTL
jgi:acetyl-CoA carboxylase biotin carboxyl carrier protein